MGYYTIPAADYQRVRSYLNASHEVGGYFEIRGSHIIPIISSNGDASNVMVSPNKPLVFHTHPGMCSSKLNCSLGVPSSQDMRQILDASTIGNVAHFIFAHEGVYVVQARCGLLEQYMRNKSIGDSIKKRFKDFQDQFLHTKLDYNTWIRKWLGFANSMGFSVKFSSSSSPSFSISRKCF